MLETTKTMTDNMRKATDDLLDDLNDEPDVELDAALIAQVFTVAAMGNWTPTVDNPFDSIKGKATCNMRIVGEAYLVAIMSGWRPGVGDPVAKKLLELGLLKKE